MDKVKDSVKKKVTKNRKGKNFKREKIDPKAGMWKDFPKVHQG